MDFLLFTPQVQGVRLPLPPWVLGITCCQSFEDFQQELADKVNKEKAIAIAKEKKRKGILGDLLLIRHYSRRKQFLQRRNRKWKKWRRQWTRWQMRWQRHQRSRRLLMWCPVATLMPTLSTAILGPTENFSPTTPVVNIYSTRICAAYGRWF